MATMTKMGRQNLLVFFSFLLLPLFGNAKTYDPIPVDARRFLYNLPGKTVTHKYVVRRAMVTSDSFKILKAQWPSVEISMLRAYIPLEYKAEFAGTYMLDRHEPNSVFGPTRNEVSQFSLGVSKYFTSGTMLSTKVSHGRSNQLRTSFASPLDDHRNSEFELGISQNLWQDAFGFATRLGLESGNLQSESVTLEITEQTEKWLEAITAVYYQAWNAQENVRAASEGLKRRQRLLKVTVTKVQRGTAEKPDLLQVKSAYIRSKLRLLEAEEKLEEIWRNLVMTLKLPTHWIGVDPLLIPVLLDNPIAEAKILCQKNITDAMKDNSTVNKVKFQKHASQNNLRIAKNQLAPTVQLGLNFSGNGIDTADGGETLSEAFAGSHPEYTVMLNAKIPLGNYAAKANLVQKVVAEAQANAQYDQSLADFHVDWLNTCTEFKSWDSKLDDVRQAHLNQQERSELEARRFRLGRTSLISIIQAGDDATDAKMSLNQSEILYRQAAWKVMRLAGESKKYLKGLVK